MVRRFGIVGRIWIGVAFALLVVAVVVVMVIDIIVIIVIAAAAAVIVVVIISRTVAPTSAHSTSATAFSLQNTSS